MTRSYYMKFIKWYQKTTLYIKLTEFQEKRITQSNNEIRNGQFSGHEEVKKRTSEWLSK
jgi:predicted transcriptional regulator